MKASIQPRRRGSSLVSATCPHVVSCGHTYILFRKCSAVASQVVFYPGSLAVRAGLSLRTDHSVTASVALRPQWSWEHSVCQDSGCV